MEHHLRLCNPGAYVIALFEVDLIYAQFRCQTYEWGQVNYILQYILWKMFQFGLSDTAVHDLFHVIHGLSDGFLD